MQTNEPETAEQIAALESAVPDLERLEVALAEGNQAQIAALERFAVEPDLKRLRDLIEEQRAEFDALDFLRLSDDEEFHSNFLAWLLDPQQNHGLGHYFLQPFLLRTGAQTERHTIDWSRTSVHREWVNEVDGQWGYLDILVLNHAEEFLCAIENKIWSWEHSGQLTRYRKALEERYPRWLRHYVFLSPRGTLPYREEEQGYWTAADYKIVLQLVERTISNTANPVKEDVRAFLQQYATTLRRNVVPDANTNIAELARKIYLEHREVVDLIKSHEPDWQSETVQILKEAVAKQSNWKLDLSDRNYVRFRSIGWDRFEAMQTGNGWAPSSNSLLLFQFRFYDQMPWLDLGLSTGDDTNNPLRNRLFESIRQRPDLFRLKTASLTDGWAILHEEKDYILDESDYGVGWDDGTTRAKIEAWVKNFAEKEFPAMNEVIVNCLEQYERETRGQ